MLNAYICIPLRFVGEALALYGLTKNIDSDAVLDYCENIMRDRGEYYFD